ncbi:MAG: hypothetical protein H0X24_10710 [Ktedonobacterales bacterium]|nr:hypothetical protein [Ktedonobacterales bacterium]
MSIANQSPARPQVALAKPLGIGLGVAFIWALGAQMLTNVFLAIRFGARGFAMSPAQPGMTVFLVVGFLVAFGLSVALGEGLRSGQKWAWWIVVVLTGALSLGGLITIPATVSALSHHDGWVLWPQLILLTLPPFIFYRLLQAPTRTWFDHVTVAAARARHNAPVWFATIIGSAAVGGFLTAIFARLG